MFPKKKSTLFHRINEREIGKTQKQPIDVCYVAIASPLTDINILRQYFSGNRRYDWQKFNEAQMTFEQAEQKAIESIQEKFDKHFASLRFQIKQTRLTADDNSAIIKQDLLEKAYWIFTMKGTPEEINSIQKKGWEVSKKEFSERILSAQDNSGKYLYTRGDYLNEQENKQENKAEFKKR